MVTGPAPRRCSNQALDSPIVPIDAPFNYVRGYDGGTEHSVTYNIENFTARLNVFVAREEDVGVASGQYNFPADEVAYFDRHYIILDHTPLVGASGGAAYRWGDYQFAFDGLFSSGLRGGFANHTQLPEVWQFNLSAARNFVIPGLGRFTNRVALLNILDRTNLIRPANGIGDKTQFGVMRPKRFEGLLGRSEV